MLVERVIEIARPREEVFAFVSDPENDPLWCPKVESVELVEGVIGVSGARYSVVHRPVPFRPSRRMDYRLVEIEAPQRLVWREDDGHDLIEVTYLLEAVGSDTRLTQLDEAELGAARLLHPLMRIGIGVDVGRQLKELRKLLERQ